MAVTIETGRLGGGGEGGNTREDVVEGGEGGVAQGGRGGGRQGRGGGGTRAAPTADRGARGQERGRRFRLADATSGGEGDEESVGGGRPELAARVGLGVEAAAADWAGSHHHLPR